MPVENRHAEYRLLLAVGKNQSVLKGFAARMHVRMQSNKPHVLAYFKRGIHFVIRIAWRNLERSIGSRKCQHAFFRQSLCKNESEPCLVRRRLSVRGVVNFKDDVGACLDQLALAGMQNLCGLTGRVADKEIARQCAGVSLFVHLPRRGGEEYTGLLILKVIGARFAEIRNDMVDDGTVGWANFEHLHPLVLRESGWDDHVLVVNHPGGGDRKRLG